MRLSKSILKISVHILCWTITSACIAPQSRGQSPRAPREEVREYDIIVKERVAGTRTTRITETDDGFTTACTDANVDLSYVVYTYHYEFHGQEVWRGNQIVSVEDHAVDGGKSLTVRARINANGSTIENSGKSAVPGPKLSMTTNYWHIPEGSKLEQLKILDADQGSVNSDQITDIASERIAVEGSQIDCSHYHLGNNLVADLWFDSEGRLVQQKSVEDGYPVEIRLRRIVTTPKQRISQ